MSEGAMQPDRFNEECALMGVYGHPEAANLVYLGLYAQQHRGQEGSGIVSSDGSVLFSHRGLGLVADVFDQEVLERLNGEMAIGHNRYATSGRTLLKNTQPFVLHFQPKGRLGAEPVRTVADFDEYVSDPAKPVPYTDKISFRMSPEYMVGDQRFASTRPDVLTYETDPLSEDVTLVGPLTADLVVSTSGTDSDWIVKLIDVYPANSPDPDRRPAGRSQGQARSGTGIGLTATGVPSARGW